MQLPVKITLKKPIGPAHEPVTELVIKREPVAGDLRGMKLGNMTFDDIITLGARLVNEPPSTLSQMSVPDFNRLSEILAAFLTDGPETGSPE